MNVFKSITSFFKELSNYVTFDYIVYGSVGLLVLVMVISLIRTNYTYEVKLLRNVSKLNKYFAKNPYVNDENIVELNTRMKNVPKALRYCWQEYMLNRDKVPSEYMNTTVCVDQPCKASAYGNVATTVGIFTIVISVLAFLLGMARMAVDEAVRFNTFLFEVLLLPLLVLALGYLFVTFLRARHTSINADLYYTFHEFERNINKACTTMPAFIDYEVLFTKKEIKEGIPVLQDYLEKRAIEEKREREEAELNASQFEYYDFDDLGVDNSLLLERAMKECEKYINVKRDLASKVQSKETEMFNYQKNFDEVTKDFERKAQASRESIAQLTDQINQTTVKIEANYMKKRLNEEQTKLQQLEKDYELASTRFQKQQDEMNAEVQTLNDEIAKRKATTEEAMKAECKNYANKIYGQISKTVQDQSKPYIDQINEDKNNLEETISELKSNVTSTTDELNKVTNELATRTEEYNVKVAEIKALKDLKAYLTSPEFKKSFLSKKEVKEFEGREIEISDDVVKQIADLEERVKLAEENKSLYEDKINLLQQSLNNANREIADTKRVNEELIEKTKQAELAKQKAEEDAKKAIETSKNVAPSAPATPTEPAKPAQETPKAETAKSTTVEKPVLQSIKKPNNDMNSKIEKIKLEIPKKQAPVSASTVRAPRRKASLDSLLNAVNKMQKDESAIKTETKLVGPKLRKKTDNQ